MTSTLTAVSLLFSLGASAATSDSFLEEALFAGGARTQGEIDRLVAKFHARVDPMVAAVKDQSNQQIAAQLLLRRFHLSYADTGALLKEYKHDAWSINEALETGHYNCLSASQLFILAARQAGLQAEGERYYDHARPIVTIDGRDFHVEPTSVSGWNVDGSYIRARSTGLTTVTWVVESPTGRGDGLLVEASWAWANEPRDAKWASRVAPTPPPLISAIPGAAGMTPVAAAP